MCYHFLENEVNKVMLFYIYLYLYIYIFIQMIIVILEYKK